MGYVEKFKALSPEGKRKCIVSLLIAFGVFGFLAYSNSNSSVTADASDRKKIVVAYSYPLLRSQLSYALSLVYSYSPLTAPARFDEFVEFFVMPPQQDFLRQMLYRRQSSAIEQGLAQAFEEEEVVFLSASNNAIIRGNLIKRFGHKDDFKVQPIFLRVEYATPEHDFFITSINTISEREYADFARRVQ